MLGRHSIYLWHAVLLGTVSLIIWLPARFLTQDGPSHLYTAQIFSRLLAHPGASPCFQVKMPPPPNSITAWTGAILIPIFGTAIAEKVWATLYLLLLVGAGSHLASKVHPSNSALGVYLFLLNPFLFAGFWNFNLAVGILFLILAVTIRFLPHPSLESRNSCRPAGNHSLFYSPPGVCRFFRDCAPFVSEPKGRTVQAVGKAGQTDR